MIGQTHCFIPNMTRRHGIYYLVVILLKLYQATNQPHTLSLDGGSFGYNVDIIWFCWLVGCVGVLRLFDTF